MSYLDSLNEKQKEAVLATEGPLLILAGAGAGKTKTVTHRILHLIRNGTAPSSILAITFTNKAANEMKERVHKLLSEDPSLNRPVSFGENPFVSTFHALGVHIIKENARLLGIPRHFAIFDRSDSKRAVKEAVQSVGLDPKQYDPGKILNVISRQKGRFMSVSDYAELVGSDYYPRLIVDVWKKYEETMAKEKALDFDDLLLRAAKLLKNNPEVLNRYQEQWKYIHIDEYQDTNEVQYVISKLLADKYKNICVVGDADQNIYSWRGAQIKNILDFEKDYPDAKSILLEQNYRSTQTILTAANSIIVKNKQRKEKNLFTKNEEGERIGLFQAYDEVDEAHFIAVKAKELIASGVSPREIAVLYRANFQSRAIEEAFLAHDVPYQVLGVRFFERKEVKDVLSFIRAALNRDSLGDLKRIVNAPPRGIGKITLLKMLSGSLEGLAPAIRTKVNSFYKLLDGIKETAEREKPSEVVKYVIRESGMEASFRDGTEEDHERLENVKELVTLATKYDALPQGEGIERLLADAALASDQDDMIKNEEAVKLMTAHASKGLEFDYVFISGLEDGLFPSKKEGESANEEQAEEERRLFYVAITRARKKVFLTYAGLRTIFGSKQVNMPSDFIFDIEDDLTERLEGYDGGDIGNGRKPLFRIDF